MEIKRRMQVLIWELIDKLVVLGKLTKEQAKDYSAQLDLSEMDESQIGEFCDKACNLIENYLKREEMRKIVVAKPATYEGIKEIEIYANPEGKRGWKFLSTQYVLKKLRPGKNGWFVYRVETPKEIDYAHAQDLFLEKENLELKKAKQYAIQELEKLLNNRRGQ